MISFLCVSACAGRFQSHTQNNTCGSETFFKQGHLYLLLYHVSYLKKLIAIRTFHHYPPHPILRVSASLPTLPSYPFFSLIIPFCQTSQYQIPILVNPLFNPFFKHKRYTRPKLKAKFTHCLTRYKGAPLYLARQCVHIAFTLGLVILQCPSLITLPPLVKNVMCIYSSAHNTSAIFNPHQNGVKMVLYVISILKLVWMLHFFNQVIFSVISKPYSIKSVGMCDTVVFHVSGMIFYSGSFFKPLVNFLMLFFYLIWRLGILHRLHEPNFWMMTRINPSSFRRCKVSQNLRRGLLSALETESLSKRLQIENSQPQARKKTEPEKDHSPGIQRSLTANKSSILPIFYLSLSFSPHWVVLNQPFYLLVYLPSSSSSSFFFCGLHCKKNLLNCLQLTCRNYLKASVVTPTILQK
ncbi:hypothetical protein VP01_795g1 [Puccinia sorghi]|uniref:Uncharacterized protein n=1 Tax=Puccinia sorghi TaxID=27349 RepID=A0A0L6UAQ4_9BASI|nr:hypothetical protein VP01_795g1 [Puccinia sorghi]